MTLEEFLAAYGAREWAPGTTDCCLMLADWALAKGLDDPAAHLRGTYDTEAGFWELIDAAGGLFPVVGDCVAVVGGRRINKPAPGVVAVIGSAAVARRQWGAIWDGTGWRVRDTSGVITVTAPVIAMWEI
ncbi:DUF6950 family protein [Pleomorphomonas koreensis]|uniref:DUF6950 family protein n=1 Tax=Pleomorphomonas koreensis TaxID=257440 RepID=UPI00047B778E